ncbi:MAG TPA: GNAT family N-acetyltransferase [Pricia sp.]|nr:GNAT family N-acetyltransferase [Pricia sp.]
MGQGYVTKAAQKCKEYAFENAFSDSLISIIQAHNVPSQKVALKLGMVKLVPYEQYSQITTP